jgi:hypothetical protein
MLFINTLMMQRIVGKPEWETRMTPTGFRAITPLGLGTHQPVRPGASNRATMGSVAILSCRNKLGNDERSKKCSMKPSSREFGISRETLYQYLHAGQ